ncbi:MAG TPA: TraB/GumN family protein [Steroidobacteraceae bacterium]
MLATVACALATMQAAPVAAEDAPLEEVLVTGQQPGPGLWKVTRPDDAAGHVLWILGSHSPLPKKMRWRSSELEAVLATSQELLAPPSVDADVGPLGGITLLPSLIGARRNPDDRRLQEVVPADLYLRWLPLKARYLGNDNQVEEWRPIFAAQELYQAALKEHGLVPYEGVWPAVEKLARKQRVHITEPMVELKVTKARSAIREFKSMPLADVDCFARTLQRLEGDMDLMREQANAWSVGDVPRLQRLAPVARATACIGAILDSSLLRERGLADVPERVRAAWMAAAEQALVRNASTVAVLSVDELLRPNGFLARLRERGYVVEDP